MGTSWDNSDIKVVLDGATDEACLHLDLSIVIPRERYIELATLMDEGRFIEAEELVRSLRPETAEYLDLFFKQRLRGISKPAPQKKAA